MTAERIPADTPLHECPERSIGLAVPFPISDRVDALVALTEAAGDRTNRKELIATLILAAPAVGDQLTTALRHYRQATARETLVNDATDDTISIASPRPGPRARRPRNQHG